jgi:hypothetical protein
MMQTLGDLWDAITILDIRIDKHPDGLARKELQAQKDLLEQEFDQVWESGGKGRAVMKHKLRTTKPEMFADQSLDDLQRELLRVNTEAWHNEDKRDKYIEELKSKPIQLELRPAYALLLIEADEREQSLNQTRNAIIDAINKKGLEKWANASA